MRNCLLAVTILIGLLGAALRPAAAEGVLDRFFGRYQGHSVNPTDEGLSARDLDVTVRPQGKGFTLAWTTVIRHAGAPVQKSYEIDFATTERDGIFGSAMQKDLFGHSEPLDPLSGKPFVWARVTGDTLTVFALLITDDGGYEMQTYDRTLTPQGMKLSFSRDRNGTRLRTVTGVLARVGE